MVAGKSNQMPVREIQRRFEEEGGRLGRSKTKCEGQTASCVLLYE